MRVWVLMHHDYDDTHLHSVWETKELAEARLAQLKAQYEEDRYHHWSFYNPDYTAVEEWEVQSELGEA